MEQHNNRRKFLKKAAVGAVVSSLPAQSVWGACTVSGALSGGSNFQQNCDNYFLIRGFSPGRWMKDHFEDKIGDMFPNHGCTNINDVASQIKSFINATDVVLVDGYSISGNHLVAVQGSTVSMNLDEALKGNVDFIFGNGFYKNLAAVYLNVHYGFEENFLIPGKGTSTDPTEVVQFIFASAVDMKKQNKDVNFLYDESVASAKTFSC